MKPANPAAAALGKLRSEMLKFYCSNGQHAEVPPCQTHTFMTKMRAATPDDKKKLLAARQEEMKKLTAEDRKKVAPHPSTPAAHLPDRRPVALRRTRRPPRRATPPCTGNTAEGCAQPLVAARCGRASDACTPPRAAQATIPDKNPEVCTNALLKNLYGKKL